MTEDGDTLFALTVRLLLAEIIAGYFPARLISELALCEAGTAATWRWGSDGAVTASLQETSHLTTVSDGALAAPGTALRPGDGSQGAVITDLRDTGLRVTVSHRAESRVRAAVARSHGGQVSVRTESWAVTLLLGTGEAQTVLTEAGVRAAVTRGHWSHRAVPAVINPAVSSSLTVPGTEQAAGTTPARGGGRHGAIRTEFHQAAYSRAVTGRRDRRWNNPGRLGVREKLGATETVPAAPREVLGGESGLS